MLEKTTKVISIKIFSFKFLFCLNRINNPNPEPVNNPDIQLPNGIIFSKYNSVITILEAQFGIKPIILDKIGLNILLLFIKLDNDSVSMIKFNKILIMMIKPVIFNV